MDLSQVFCPHDDCPDKGKVGEENIVSHGIKRKRCKCQTCDRTFSYRRGTMFENLKTDEETVTTVVNLVANGCPLQAIVRVFGFDERTVADWVRRAGVHTEQFHKQQVRPLALGQIQVDEIRFKLQALVLWVAMAIMVGTRLWLGAAVSERRDKHLIRQIAAITRAWALPGALVIAFDGFAAYFKAFKRAFSDPLRAGRIGRPPLIVWEQLTLVQVVKHKTQSRFEIARYVLLGSCTMLKRLLNRTQGAGVINTAYIERINATFRACFAPFARRTRCLARKPETVRAGVFLVGCLYNFCWLHDSLAGKTPAMAAELTDHVWSVSELLWFRVQPSHSPSTV